VARKLRVLYDISGLGLGQISTHAQAGSYRVDRHLIEMLSASGECDLLFCANHSSLAQSGCVEYLRHHPGLAHVPLVSNGDGRILRLLRGAVVAAHRRLKAMRGGHALPGLVRAGGALVDARVRQPVVDATPPVDIHHSSTTPLPPRPRRRRSPKRFVTIYDLRATRFEVSSAEVAYQKALLASIGDDDCVLTSSESTRQDLCELGVAEPHRIFVAPLAADKTMFHPDAGADEPDALRARHGIPPGRFVLILNSLHPRKNVAGAVEAFVRLVRQDRVADVSLVIAGSPAPLAGPVAAVVDRVGALRERIVSTGHVTDPDLAALYRAALVFVYPSFYEGFGLPPLEAMQCGTPVITSNTWSLPEVVGDAGVMVDPQDTDALSAAMLAFCRDPAWRQSVRQNCLARAALFSWERTTACTIAAYRAALSA
jgi:glycosyltransferase involved in cell wall biosynthesis